MDPFYRVMTRTALPLAFASLVGCGSDRIVHGVDDRAEPRRLEGEIVASFDPGVATIAPGETERLRFVTGVGDVDGDGYDDLAVAGKVIDRQFVAIVPGEPKPFLRFQLIGQAATTRIELGERAEHVRGLGDVNGDGYDDFQVSLEIDFQRTQVLVFFGGELPESMSPIDAAAVIGVSDEQGTAHGVGDLDEDGYDDFVLSRTTAGQWLPTLVFYGNPAPVWEGPSFADAFMSHEGDKPGIVGVAGGDVDGDGFRDLVTSSVEDSLRVAFGNGQRLDSFVETEDFAAGFEGLALLNCDSLLDFNGDGADDLVVGTSRRNVRLIAGGSADSFFDGSAVLLRSGEDLTHRDGLGDVDGDGDDELAVANHELGERVEIFYGRPDLPETPVEPDAVIVGHPDPYIGGGRVGNLPSGAAGDINGDGFADYVLTGKSLGSRGSRAFIVYGGN